MRAEIILSTVGLLILFASVSAGDGWQQLPCERANQAEMVFVGQVLNTKIDPIAAEQEQFNVDFIVREAFVATSTGEKVTAVSSLVAADYAEIKVGGAFVVYAGRRSAGPGATLGWGTKPLNKATADLMFLRHAVANEIESRIFGSASFFYKSSLYRDFRQPIASVALRVTSRESNKSIDTITDEYGNFDVVGLPPGLYAVGMQSPLKARLIAYEPSILLRKFGCQQTDVEVRFETQVKGTIVDTNGLPIAKASLELLPIEYQKPKYGVDGPNERSQSDDRGIFVISNVPPGRYHLAVNYNALPEKESPYPTSYFPGTPDRRKAQVIQVTDEKDVDGLLYVLRSEKLAEKRISGRIIYPDGRPVANSDIYLKEDENEVCCVLEKAVSDEKGRFVLTGFATRKYRIWTFVEHRPFADKINYIGTSQVFVLDNSTVPFTIVMNATTKSSLDALDEIESRERRKIR